MRDGTLSSNHLISALRLGPASGHVHVRDHTFFSLPCLQPSKLDGWAHPCDGFVDRVLAVSSVGFFLPPDGWLAGSGRCRSRKQCMQPGSDRISRGWHSLRGTVGCRWDGMGWDRPFFLAFFFGKENPISTFRFCTRPLPLRYREMGRKVYQPGLMSRESGVGALRAISNPNSSLFRPLLLFYSR